MSNLAHVPEPEEQTDVTPALTSAMIKKAKRYIKDMREGEVAFIVTNGRVSRIKRVQYSIVDDTDD